MSHQELRDDRAVFFIDHPDRGGSHSLSYLARVTSAGEAIAPPAKVEAMYDPQSFALSSSSHSFKTPDPLVTAARADTESERLPDQRSAAPRSTWTFQDPRTQILAPTSFSRPPRASSAPAAGGRRACGAR